MFSRTCFVELDLYNLVDLQVRWWLGYPRLTSATTYAKCKDPERQAEMSCRAWDCLKSRQCFAGQGCSAFARVTKDSFTHLSTVIVEKGCSDLNQVDVFFPT